MATSSEQLAQAVSAINSLNQTYSQEVGKWQTERTAMTAQVAAALAAMPSLRKQFFVDAVAGVDTNDGTSSKPFATIEKALSLATTFFGGQIEILLRPGVYDVTSYRSYNNLNLYIGGTAAANVNDVIINWRANAHDLVNGLFRMRFCTTNRVNVDTASHQKAIVKLTGGCALFGAYVVGGISATNRAFHFISEGCPLVACESGGGFASTEYMYAENTAASATPLVQQRGMTLIYKPVNSILSNFSTPPTEIKHASVTL